MLRDLIKVILIYSLVVFIKKEFEFWTYLLKTARLV
jgi:hypothetical protein